MHLTGGYNKGNRAPKVSLAECVVTLRWLKTIIHDRDREWLFKSPWPMLLDCPSMRPARLSEQSNALLEDVQASEDAAEDLQQAAAVAEASAARARRAADLKEKVHAQVRPGCNEKPEAGGLCRHCHASGCCAMTVFLNRACLGISAR